MAYINIYVRKHLEAPLASYLAKNKFILSPVINELLEKKLKKEGYLDRRKPKK